MIEISYNERNNPNIVTFKEDGVAIPFGAATRMVCTFRGSAIVADTDNDPNLIDWSLGDGDVEFNLNFLGLLPRKYRTTVIVYDPLHPNGQILVHDSTYDLVFDMRNTDIP